MTTPTTSIVAASILAAGLGLATLPEGGKGAEAARIIAKNETRHSDRLEEAFRLADAVAVDEEVLATVTAAARKADRLPRAVDCTGQAWPNLDSHCLAGLDGGRSGPAMRTVTVEYRVGESTSVLVRLPAPQIAGY